MQPGFDTIVSVGDDPQANPHVLQGCIAACKYMLYVHHSPVLAGQILYRSKKCERWPLGVFLVALQ